MNKLVGVSDNCSRRFGARVSRWRDNGKNLFRKIGVACFGVIRTWSYSAETAFKYCLIKLSEAGLSEAGFPRRSVPLKSPWRPTSENRERILPMYESADSGVKVMLHGTIFNDNF